MKTIVLNNNGINISSGKVKSSSLILVYSVYSPDPIGCVIYGKGGWTLYAPGDILDGYSSFYLSDIIDNHPTLTFKTTQKD